VPVFRLSHEHLFPDPSLAEEDDFARAAVAAGLTYDALIQKILDAACA